MSLLNVRKGHRQHVNKTITSVKVLLEQHEPSTSELKKHKQTLPEKKEVIGNLDDLILATLTEAKDIEEEIDEAGDFRSSIQGAIFNIEEKLEGVQEEERKPVHPPPQSTSSFEEAKFPRIQIKKFAGDMVEFQSFWDCFDAMIDRKSTFSDVTKFAYLKSFLRGQALSAVQGLQLTDGNYKEAVEILQNRFGNKQMVIRGYEEIDKCPASD